MEVIDRTQLSLFDDYSHVEKYLKDQVGLKEKLKKLGEKKGDQKRSNKEQQIKSDKIINNVVANLIPRILLSLIFLDCGIEKKSSQNSFTIKPNTEMKARECKKNNGIKNMPVKFKIGES